MMRIGQNPGKLGIKSYASPELAVAIVNYIPEETGYFLESLPILKIQIASINKNTKNDFDLIVFDNGSCPKVQTELHLLLDQGKIDFLVLSRHNLGKIGAINFILPSLPHQWICFSDSDVLFRQGWFENSMSIFFKFTNAGMVSAQPAFFESERKDTFTLQDLTRSGFPIKAIQPDPWIAMEYCRGIGADLELQEKYLNKKLDCVLDESGNVVSVIGACHMQFLASRDQLKKILPIPSQFTISREEDSELDSRISQSGKYRLSTLQPYVIHMGNHLDKDLIQEIKDMNLENAEISFEKEGVLLKKGHFLGLLVFLNRLEIFKRLFKRLYKELFVLFSIDRKHQGGNH
ncbi:MAG: glycosyltransferase [Chloroflexi bacterium]|nr:glycosyltransferase [Chloroflexota bacterium]